MDVEPFAVIVERISPGAKLTRWRPLKGGVSASVHALEFVPVDGTPKRVVVRRHGSADWKNLESDVTSTEFALLKALHAD